MLETKITYDKDIMKKGLKYERKWEYNKNNL